MRKDWLSTTLMSVVAALTFGVGTAHAASLSDAERDARVEAIEQLINGGFRLPAKRAIDEFGRLGAEELYKDALTMAYANAFRASVTDKAEAKRLEDLYAQLKTKLEPRIKSKNLPGPLNSLVGGDATSVILLRVNEILRTMDPNCPATGPNVDSLTEEKIAGLNNAVKILIEVAGKEFAASVEKVKANKATEDSIAGLPESQSAKLEQEATLLRRAAIANLYYAHIALREVSTRGDKFKIDPQPANEFWKTTLSQYKTDFDAWEFEWAALHPELQAWMNVLYCEGVRQGVDGYKADDAETGALAVCDIDLSQFKDAKIKDAVSLLELKHWAHLLRWQLEQNTPAALERGIDNFSNLQTRLKGDKQNTLSAPGERGAVLGEIWISAARLYMAKGDNSRAGGLLVEVQSSKNTRGYAAKQWMINSGTSAGGDDWGAQPMTEEPGKAVTVAGVYLSRAANANAAQAKKFYLTAAVHLRNGVLGLNSGEYDEQFVESAPVLYMRYASALSKLQLRQQAAVVSYEGLRSIAARITEKTNPWKASNGTWTKAGESMRTFANNALLYINYLNAMTRTSSSAQMNDAAVEIVRKIDESLVGKGQEWGAIIGKKQEKDYAGAVEAARAYAGKYKEDYYKAFGLITSIRLDWISDLNAKKDEKKAAEVVAELDKTIKGVEPKIDEELKRKDLSAEQLKQLKDAKNTCTSAHIDGLLQQKKFAEVVEKLGAKFWETPPSDPDLGARMLSLMTKAVYENQLAMAKDAKAKAEPDQLLADWPRVKTVDQIFRKYSPRYDNATVSLDPSRSRLAATAQNASNLADSFAARNVKAGDMDAIADEAKRIIAVHFKPKPDTKPRQLFAIANIKWEIGDKSGAAEMFENYKKALDADPLVTKYRADPEGAVKEFAETLDQRQNFKRAWEDKGGIRDLLVDRAGFLEEYKTTPKDKLTEAKRDFRAAVDKVKEFGKLIEAEGTLVGPDGKAKLVESHAKLLEMVQSLSDLLVIDSKLAQQYRASGQADKAIPIYETLYRDYDPLNEDYATGYVEGVLEALRHGQQVEPKAIDGARAVAVVTLAQVERDASKKDVYWMAYIQHLELSAHLKDNAIVEKRLMFAEKNHSSPADDLFKASPEGTDKRVRTPRDKLAVDLAQRFLDLYQFAPSMKPPFRIETLSLPNGNPYPVFLPVDAPKFEARVVSNDGDESIVVVEVGAPADAGIKKEADKGAEEKGAENKDAAAPEEPKKEGSP